jgi:hypothetical protein
MLLTAVPFFVGATWRLPDTYHSAGFRRGTATLKFYGDRDILDPRCAVRVALICDGDVGTLLGEPPSDGGTDTPASPRDEGERATLSFSSFMTEASPPRAISSGGNGRDAFLAA